MSFKYLALKRIKKTMELGLTNQALEFDANVLVWWLEVTEQHYRLCIMPPVFSSDAIAFLDSHRTAAEAYRSSMPNAARFLLDLVIRRCLMDQCRNFDSNLRLIAWVSDAVSTLSSIQGKSRTVRYTLKRPRDGHYRLMTIRSDVVRDFGLECAGFILEAFRKAESRELGVPVRIVNLVEVFGESAAAIRPAPDYPSLEALDANNIFHDHLAWMSVDNLRASIQEISCIAAIFKRFVP